MGELKRVIGGPFDGDTSAHFAPYFLVPLPSDRYAVYQLCDDDAYHFIGYEKSLLRFMGKPTTAPPH